MKRRIAKNTIIIYVKLVIVIFVGLFTTRIVFNSLGEDDFGLFGLIASTIALISILTSALNVTSVRFIARSLGSSDEKLIRDTFQSSITIHLLVGISGVLILELVGIFLFDGILNIPPQKILEAKFLYHAVVGITFLTIITVPFESLISAHEDFIVLSFFEISAAFLRLSIALCLPFLSGFVLAKYGLLIFLVHVILRISMQAYCLKKYNSCQLKLSLTNFKIFKEMFSFGKWSLLSSMAGMGINQGRDILFNLFFGLKLNAANSISGSVGSNVNNFSSSLAKAFNPIMFKSEGAGNRSLLKNLVIKSSRFSIYLFMIFAIPVYIEIDYLVYLWLGTIPEFTIVFIKLLLIGMFIEKFTFEITTAVRAIGRIKLVSIIESLLRVIPLPMAYFLFQQDFEPPAFMFLMIISSIFIALFRLFYAKQIVGLDTWYFYHKVIKIPLIVMSISFFTTYLFSGVLDDSILSILAFFLFSTATCLLSMWLIGLEVEEKLMIRAMLNRFTGKFLLKW